MDDFLDALELPLLGLHERKAASEGLQTFRFEAQVLRVSGPSTGTHSVVAIRLLKISRCPFSGVLPVQTLPHVGLKEGVQMLETAIYEILIMLLGRRCISVQDPSPRKSMHRILEVLDSKIK